MKRKSVRRGSKIYSFCLYCAPRRHCFVRSGIICIFPLCVRAYNSRTTQGVRCALKHKTCSNVPFNMCEKTKFISLLISSKCGFAISAFSSTHTHHPVCSTVHRFILLFKPPKKCMAYSSFFLFRIGNLLPSIITSYRRRLLLIFSFFCCVRNPFFCCSVSLKRATVPF